MAKLRRVWWMGVITTLSIEVRHADPRDARAIAEVHRTAWIGAYAGMIPHRALVQLIERRREDWWRRAARGPSTLMVVEVANKIAGYATIGLNRVKAASCGPVFTGELRHLEFLD